LLQKNRKILLAVFIVGLLILANESIYKVGVAQQVVVTQFSGVVGEPRSEPGIYLKIPFIQKTHYLSKHLVNKWESDLIQLKTYDKKLLCIKNLVMWEIGDPINYFNKFRNRHNVAKFLDDAIRGATKDTIASYYFSEILEDQNIKQNGFVLLKEEINDKILDMIVIQLSENGIKIVKLKSKCEFELGDVVDYVE
jgi:membrane protease subunit HflC